MYKQPFMFRARLPTIHSRNALTLLAFRAYIPLPNDKEDSA